MTPPAQPTPDDEISLLDILVVLAENFWLILLVPLAIGAITFGVVSFQPKAYESIAILRSKVALDTEGNAIGESAAVMVARLNSPELQAAAFQSYKELRGEPAAVSATASADGNSLINIIAQGPSAGEAQGYGQALIGVLVPSIRSAYGEPVTMQDIILQAPTLNNKAIKPKRLQLAAMAVILSGLVLTVFVFIRAAVRGLSSNPEGAEKVARIRRGILRR
jgi:capsular polysaccharide biosynthesis protein